MAKIDINIPDNQVQRVIDSFCSFYNYQPTINELPNPETKVQFFKRLVVEYVRGIVIASEGQLAADLAKENAATSAKQISIS